MIADEIAERFARETTEHAMTVLHDDGLYRHLRFKQPGSPLYWFEIVTAPGVLIFNGDGESFVFRRVEDMFTFFRGPVGRVNLGYWAEKVTSSRDALMRYDREVFESVVMSACSEAIHDGGTPRGLARAVREELLSIEEAETEEGARQALASFEHDGFRFFDTWKWQLQDYYWWFVWALHGIVWGIAQYDAHHGRDPQVARSPRAEAAASRTLAGRPVITVTLPEPVATAIPQGGGS